MKIAVNKCFGGFSLSEEAILELVKLKSKLISKSKISEWSKTSTDFKEHLKPFKNGFKKHEFYHLIVKDGFVYGFDSDYEYKNRSNPDLINVIKKLGSKVNTSVSDIKIVKIPDDVDYIIDGYDGIETIHEKHRSW